tara:strand:+ start:37 stop:768 length:732 start_codon:yes stop_codon:yes gene_type:complete
MSRDLNKEYKDNDRKYHYNFDYDVMHPYMLDKLLSISKNGSILELGCFKGKFTKLLCQVDKFTKVEAIEGSSDAAIEAELNLPSDVDIHVGDFESIELEKKYKNIVMTHVLEHLDDTQIVLKRIFNWLEDDGIFFVVCPNANAASRQIAVHMNLIEYNSAVTPAEWEHGHRITFNLDTLEHAVKKSGLKVIDRGGIFFKALANFQWDKVINQKIVSKQYLDGCYKLGDKYPDLCSSIYVVASR